MMRRISIAITSVLCVMTASATAEPADCPDLGLDSAFLSDHFCAQLQSILPQEGQPTGTTRSITQEGNPDLPDDQDWANFPLIQEAFRADPRKTLELIKRIKGAGGLPVENQ